MRIDATRGTFQNVIGGHAPQVRAIARSLRKLIGEIDPEGIEIPRPSENHASYSVSSDNTIAVYGYICPLQDYVRLGFYFGGSVPDPEKLLVGTGKRLRHVKLYSVQAARRPAVRALLEAAVAERKQAHGLAARTRRAKK